MPVNAPPPVMRTAAVPGMRACTRWVCAAACLIMMADVACAAIRLDKTRVIVTGETPKVVVQVKSAEALPILIQAWVDTEQDNATQDADQTQQTNPLNTTFLIDPPVVRIDPGESRALQILLTQAQALPQDRESLFWFNVLEVPVTVREDVQQNQLQLSVQSRMKLFYRPAGISETVEKLRFTVERETDQTWLVMENPAARYQTVASLRRKSQPKPRPWWPRLGDCACRCEPRLRKTPSWCSRWSVTRGE